MLSTQAMKRELKERFGATVRTGELGQYNRDYLRRAREGELEQVARGIWSTSTSKMLPGLYNPSDDMEDEPEDKPVDATKIKQRFNMLERLGLGVVANNIRSLIVSGSAGVGKTYTLETQLKAAQRNGEIVSYESIKGSISAIGLFKALWENKDEGQVLLLDDIDRIFGDEEALNLLKAALDTSETREISWAKASRYLENEDIPNKFEYEGQIIFITNMDLDRIVAKQGRLAPHVSALMSRSIFLDLCIHNPQAIMVRVEQVLEESTLAENLKINKKQTEAIIEWMKSNLNGLRSVSIRTVTQLAGFIKTEPKDWQMMAEVTLLKSVG